MSSNTYVTFSDLTPIATIESGDLFAITDISSSESASITFGALQNSILSNTAITNNVDDIISAINSYDDGSGTNGLNATTLGDQDSDYYLDYSNFANTPAIPSNLSELTNNTGFIRYDSSSSPARLIYQNNEGGGSTTLVTTTNVREGTNLYYTDDRVEGYFDSNFASYLSLYVATFDDGNSKDSLLDTAGTFQNISVSQSNTIQVDSSVISNYSAGQSLRVYGASTNLDNEIASLTSTFTVTNVNFDSTGDANTSPRQFSYKITEFDFETGDISPSSSASSVEIGIPSLLSGTVNDVNEAFNATYFIRLNFSSVPVGKGLLIYRSVGTVSGPVSGTYKLMAVLGPKEINAGQYIDYYTFDYNSWSGKNASDNTYSSIVHFPLTPPASTQKGWADATISSVNTTTNRIQLTDIVYVNAAGACVVSHNDTSTIQTAINSNSTAGRKTITLNAKTYVSDNLSLPDNFSITGVPNISKIRRLPWSGYASLSSNIITSSSGSATNVSLVGFDIDGSLPNQFLYQDTTDGSKNYAVDLGNLTSGCLIDKVRINNVIGGGVWNTIPSEFRFINSEVVSSGVTDRYDYSPLVAYDGSNIVVNNNRFQDFTQYIDVSTTNKGVVTNNIVSNCGSGILVYGSSYVISSPNVLIGPGNEFLPSPDILNSEYDSINVDLTSAFLANTQFTSDTFVYQENGNVFDLTQNSGFIYYSLFLLQKLANGAEEIYDNSVTGIALNEKAGLDKTVGQFGFNISKADVDKIKLADGEFSYSSLSANNANHVGIAWSASYEQYVPAGSITGEVSANNDVYSVTIEDMEYISVGSLVKFDGHTGFDVDANSSPIGTVLTVVTVLTSSDLTIQFDGATITEGTANTGTINIVDRFVLAQGRIL